MATDPVPAADPTPERWRRIEEVFDAVVVLAPAKRAAALARACGDDLDLMDQVARLLRRESSQGRWIDDLLEGLCGIAPPEEPRFVGRRFGAYQVVREIGRGGQGIVFEAARDDDEFQQRVALKVATRAVYSPEFLVRFRHERQILAQLQHPHIARLLDGGTADDGTPYFAMEYVEGVTITEHCEAQRLPVAQRLRLFLQACDAVDYAHQNLVIHRDLKPGNILVAAGSVRLLDFGIAKLVDAADGGRTQSGTALITPDYCSPEQLRGQPITTRTDVYSLGLVLSELLTGQPAQRADTKSPLAMERSICEVTAEPPSAVASAAGDHRRARLLRGDLDTIVATATRKDAASRYPSVAALAEDVRRHLDGRPITARQDSRWYRARRFARRHWRPMAAGLTVVATLAAGILATAHQARRAERRFQQVRGIANALMVDVHGAIQDLPGATRAQEVVVTTAVRYLDGLATEAAGDRALLIELAQGYARVGQLEYALNRPSLGRAAAAGTYFEKARRILDSLVESDPDDVTAATARVALGASLAGFLLDTNHSSEALRTLQHAIRVADESLVRHPDDVGLLVALRDAQNVMVSRLDASPEARRELPRYLANAERIAALQPQSAASLTQLGVAHAQAGKLADADGLADAAARHFRRNLDLQSAVAALEPDNATVRRNLMIGWSHVADAALGPLGSSSYTGPGGPPSDIDPAKRAEALDASEKAIEHAEWLRRRDPANDTVVFDYAVCLGRRAPAFPPGDARAVAVLEQALGLLAPLAGRYPAVVKFLIEFRGSKAERHRQAGQFAQAVREWKAVDTTLRDAIAADPEGYYPRRLAIPIFQNWAMATAAAGDPGAALDLGRRAVRLADDVGAREAQYARAPGWPPRVRSWFAELCDAVGDRRAGEAARVQGRAMWARIAARDDLPADLQAEADDALR